jgi:hypothetical protein
VDCARLKNRLHGDNYIKQSIQFLSVRHDSTWDAGHMTPQREGHIFSLFEVPFLAKRHRQESELSHPILLSASLGLH